MKMPYLIGINFYAKHIKVDHCYLEESKGGEGAK